MTDKTLDQISRERFNRGLPDGKESLESVEAYIEALEELVLDIYRALENERSIVQRMERKLGESE